MLRPHPHNPAHEAHLENDMQRRIAPEDRTTRRILPMAFAAALALALTVSLAEPAHAHRIKPPPVPTDVAVPDGTKPFLVGHAVGTQNYICLPSGSAFAWTIFTPQAVLFDDRGKQLTTHFFSPNPLENGTVRPAWQHSRDTSTVWVRLVRPSTDPDFVAPGAIPWLLLEMAGAGAGPKGGDALTRTAYIQRLNTAGGVAPSTGCSGWTEVGKKEFIPYTADYYFYFDPASDED